MDKNRRPKDTDDNVIKMTVTDFAEKNREYLLANEFITEKEGNLEYFINRMSKSLSGSRSFDVYKIAADYGGSSNIDDDIVELVEALVGHNDKIHKRFVIDWVKYTNLQPPFEGVSRVSLTDSYGVEASGIAVISGTYKEVGKLTFIPDGDRENWTDPTGHIVKWRIHTWESIVSKQALTDEDRTVWDRHIAAETAIKEKREASDRILNAEKKFEALVKSHKAMPIDEARAIYEGLELTPESAAKYVMALTLVSKTELASKVQETKQDPTSEAFLTVLL